MALGPVSVLRLNFSPKSRQVGLPDIESHLFATLGQFLHFGGGEGGSPSRWRTEGHTASSMKWRTVSRISFWGSLSEKSIVSLDEVHTMLSRRKISLTSALPEDYCHRMTMCSKSSSSHSGLRARGPR
jgi:hypothetical protein